MACIPDKLHHNEIRMNKLLGKFPRCMPALYKPCCITYTVITEIGDVCKALRPAKGKWEKIGLGIGLSADTLHQIKSNKKGDPGQCLYATINAWLRHQAPSTRFSATWRTLLRALESSEVDEAALAERIKGEKGWDCNLWTTDSGG